MCTHVGIMFLNFNNMLLLFSFAAAISKRMIMSFYKLFLLIKSGMVHVHAEFDEDICLQYCFMNLHSQNTYRHIDVKLNFLRHTYRSNVI